MRDGIVRSVQANRELIEAIIDMIPIPLFLKDRAGRYIDCNGAFMSFLSVGRDQIIGKSVYDIWSQDEADVFSAQDDALLERGGIQVYESAITSSDGASYEVQFHKQVFTDSSGEKMGLFGAIFDISEKKRLERALASLAATDELTGMANRREGMSCLERVHDDSDRKRRSYCLGMVDIDHFKCLNDRFGHLAGDLVLQAFSQLAGQELRGCDVCFRYGGEEFVVVLPSTTLDEGLAVMERLREAWAAVEVSAPDGSAIRSTVSIGLSRYALDDTSFDEVLQAGDRALYEAKRAGRNCTVCADRSGEHSRPRAGFQTAREMTDTCL
jgi:diguanylate cyclase (GGDEF)-like protein/PAS domain S-box-containing protein